MGREIRYVDDIIVYKMWCYMIPFLEPAFNDT